MQQYIEMDLAVGESCRIGNLIVKLLDIDGQCVLVKVFDDNDTSAVHNIRIEDDALQLECSDL